MKVSSFVKVVSMLLLSLAFLTACGGGGSSERSSVTSTLVPAVPETASPPTLSIPLVTTVTMGTPGVVFQHQSIPKITAVVGEINVVVARVTRTNHGGVIRRVNRLEFTNFMPLTYDSAGNSYPYSLKWVFPNKALTLRDAKGGIAGRVPYFITYEDEKLVVTFENGYYGENLPETLDLVSSISPHALPVQMALSLTNVEYEKPSTENILVPSRESMATMLNIRWTTLPLVETFSPKLQYSSWSSSILTVANVYVTCPTDGITRSTCYLADMEMIHIGSKDIRFSGGYHLYNKVTDGDVSSFATNFSVGPGESAPFSLDAVATSYSVTSEISKMVFVVNGVRVAPIVINNYMTCESVLEPLARQQCSSQQQGGKG